MKKKTFTKLIKINLFKILLVNQESIKKWDKKKNDCDFFL